MAQKSRPWFSSLFSIDRIFGFKERVAKGKRQRSTQLNLERLEDRTVPTVVFDPFFGPETPTQAGPYTVTSNPTVHLIFWGSTWTTNSADAALETKIISDAQTILSSTYLNDLTEYGSSGTATFGKTYNDPTNPVPAGYNAGNPFALDSGGVNTSQTDLNNEITTVLNTAGSGIPKPGSGTDITKNPFYVVIPAPEVSNTNGGYNIPGTYSGDPINMISVGTAGGGVDSFTLAFGHEVAERMTDAKFDATSSTPSSGVELTPPAALPLRPTSPFGPPITPPGGFQIGDGEAEPGGQPHFGYRINGPNGVEVQPYYSVNTAGLNGVKGTFVVSDGNTQSLYLNPIWNTTNPAVPILGNGSIPQYNLTINGDQLANVNDSITLSGFASTLGGTGLSVDLNGETYQFDPNTIQQITVNGLTGSNTMTLDFSNGNFLPTNGISFNGGTGPTGSLVLKGGSFTNEVDTATGAQSGVITLDGKTVTYSNLSSLVDTATATNFFVNGTGAVGQTINVVGTPPPGTENGFPSDEVNSNDFTMVDFANKTNLTVKAAINANLATAGPSTFTVDVTTAALGLNTLTLDGGGKGSTFNVQATPVAFSTTLDGTGAGGDAYNIFSDAGVGSPPSGNLAGILGLVTVKADGSTTNRLIVSDQGNVAADAVKLTNAAIIVTGGATATIDYGAAPGGAFTDGAANDGILFLGANLGAGGNVFNVVSTLAGSSTLVDGGSGSDAFFIADSGLGAASTNSFNGQGGNNSFIITSVLPVSAALFIDGGTSSLNVLFGPNVNATWNITGTNQGNITGVVTAFKDLQYLIGGTGDDTFLFSTGASEGTINGGYGNNTVVGAPDQINAFDISGGNAGSIVGALPSFGNIQNLAGSTAAGNTGTDVFEFFMTGGLAGHIAGGTGSEWLYYEPMSMPIWVNLSIGVVSRLGGGETHLANSPMNVIGSSVGGDIIIGDASGGVLEGHNGGNTIEAGSGRTIIIGGYGKNYLVGGSADDLIIAGATVYDFDILTLTGFLTEWQSAKSFGTRVYDLRTGTGQAGGHALILNVTVICPSTPPGPRFGYGGGEGQTTMVGGGGDNWFFTLYPTTIVDLQSTDDLN